MRTRDDLDRNDRGEGETGTWERTRATLFDTGLVLAVCLFLASLGPRELVPLALSGMLNLAAVVSAMAALVRREAIWADHATHWDAAALLLALSIASGWLVDMEAIQAMIEAQAPATGAETSEAGPR